MTDLTQHMQAAIMNNSQWVAAQVHGLLEEGIEAVCKAANLRIFGEWTTDEAWAFLEDIAERPIACIWRRAPFAFVTLGAPPELRAFLGTWQAQLIEMDDWYTSTFSIDLEAMSPFRPWFDWHTSPDIVSPSKMTLLDFVYATH